MDEKIIKKREILNGLLQGDLAQISSVDGHSEVSEYLSHNEFEVALNALERHGSNASVNMEYWRNLKKAAELMELSVHYPALLISRIVHRIWVFRASGVHSAWVDDLTLPIVAYAAFLEFSDGELVRINPSELKMWPDRYSGLNLELESSSPSALRLSYSKDQCIDAVPLEEVLPFLPFSILRIDESDPVGDGLVSQYALTTSNGQRIVFRHIMPPTTLGIEVTQEHSIVASENELA